MPGHIKEYPVSLLFFLREVAVSTLLLLAILLSAKSLAAQTCNCTEYIYLNEVSSGGAIHKYTVNADGSLTEVGAPWYDNSLAGEQITSPHGLTIGDNGLIYVGESATNAGDIRQLNCDGDLAPETSFVINNGGQTSMVARDGSVYTNDWVSNEWNKYDQCTGALQGTVTVCSGELRNWGLTYDANSGNFYATSSFDFNEPSQLIAFTDADFDNDPLTCVNGSVLTNIPANNVRVTGVVTDDLGNIYVAVQQDKNLNPTGSYIVKYDSNLNYLTSSAIDDNENGVGWYNSTGIVYSSTADLLYVSTTSNVDDCVSVFDTNLSYVGYGVPPAGNGDNAKGIAITTECCPATGMTVIDTIICNGVAATPILLQDILCIDGFVCEGIWTEDPGNTGLTFDSCDDSVTGIPDGCGTFTLSSDGTNSNSQCGAFTMVVNIRYGTNGPIDITGDQTICEGDDPTPLSVILLPVHSGTLSYQWQSSTTSCTSGFTDIAGATSNSYDPPAGLTATTYYRLTTTVDTNCESGLCEEISNCVTITVDSQQQISITPDETEVCLGETVDITASISGGNGNCAIQWQRRPQGGAWVDIHNGQTTVTAGLGFLTAPGVYQYRARYSCVGSGCAEEVSNVVNINVFAQPVASMTTSVTELCVGDIGSATATESGGTGSCVRQWQRRPQGGTWANVHVGQTSPPISLPSVGTWEYRVTYTCDGSGCDPATSNIVVLEAIDPEISISVQEPYVCLGETMDITAAVAGGGTSCTIQWERRPAGGVWATAHSGQTTVTAGTDFLTAPGIYEYRATYDCGSCDVTSTLIKVFVLDDAPSQIVAPIVTCPDNDPGLITDASADPAGCNFVYNHEADNGTSDWSLFNWPGVIDPPSTLSVDATGVLSGANSFYMDIPTIGTADYQIQILSQPHYIIAGETYALSFEAVAEANRDFRIVLSDVDAGVPIFIETPSLTTTANTYTYTYTASQDINNLRISIYAGGSDVNFWFDNMVFENSTCSQPNYQWQIRESNGAGGFEPWADITGATSEEYDPAPITGVTRYRRISSFESCSNSTISNMVEVDILESPILTTTDDEICIQETATISVTATNGIAPYTYAWSSGGTAASENVMPGVDTDYFVTVTDANGCVTVGTASVIVNPLPTIVMGVPANVCVDAGVQSGLGDAMPQGGIYSGNGVTDDGNGMTYSLDPAVAGVGTTSLSYMFTDSNGCAMTETFTYEIYSVPTVTIDPQGPLCENGSTITLTASPIGGTFAGTGVSGNFFDPTVAGVGIHTITYNYTDANACIGSGTIDIEVYEVPTATTTFTNPDCGAGDGTITFSYPNNSANRTNIEFSIDGGVTYPYNALVSAGTITISNLGPGTYDLWTRWGNSDCPADLADVTLVEDQTPTCVGIIITRN